MSRTEIERKTNILKYVIPSLFSLAILLIMFGFTSKREEIEKIKEDLEKKAETTYVDQKCLEVKNDAAIDRQKIYNEVKEVNRKTDEILKLMITERK